MRSATTSTSLLLLALTSGTAAAHPGHGIGGGSQSFLHYATEPQHLGLLALLAVAATLGLTALKRRRALQLARIDRRPRHRRDS